MTPPDVRCVVVVLLVVGACGSAPPPKPATVPVVDPNGCPPGTTWRARDLADPDSDDQVIRHETACVLPDGTFHGPYELHHGSTVTARGVYDHGKRTGVWRELGDAAGGYREGPYAADVQDGAWRSFHAPGVVAWTGTFKHGVRHGKFAWFTPAGALAHSGELVDDKQDGTWTYYRADGTVERTEQWSKGQRVR